MIHSQDKIEKVFIENKNKQLKTEISSKDNTKWCFIENSKSNLYIKTKKKPKKTFIKIFKNEKIHEKKNNIL